MSDFWRRATCSHTRTTEPDERGDALCQDCGGSVRVTLTQAAFFETVAALEREPHKHGCVETEHGWVCVPACPLHRPGP